MASSLNTSALAPISLITPTTSSPAATPSQTGTWALVGVVSAIGVGLAYLFWPAHGHGGARENPLSTPTTRGKTVAYRARISQDPAIESVRMHADGKATLYRFDRPIATFSPLPYQLVKIRSGRGVLLIFTDQLL